MGGTDVGKQIGCGNRYFGVSAVIVIFLSGLCPLCVGAADTRQPTDAPRADASALCTFITGKMQSALPQVPTLCARVTETANAPNATPGTLIISVFSPTDVLEGKMRRAWSTALFQTAEALYFQGALNGACELDKPRGNGTCELRVSDSSLSQSGIYYGLNPPPTWTAILGKSDLGGDPASDKFYSLWWQLLEAGTASGQPDRPGVYAENFARFACKDFTDKVRQYNTSVPNSKDQIPEPSCSAILTTNSSVYVAIDYPDILDAAMGNNLLWLSDTFGKEFSHTEYDGMVIFRSPWNKDSRVYRMYPLRDVDFCWDEVHAGVRNSDNAFVFLATSVEIGVEDRHSLVTGPSNAVVRTPSVVSVTQVAGSDFALVDLTDGSEWSVPAKAQAGCKLNLGSQVVELPQPNDTAQLGMIGCTSGLRATFVQGW